MDLELINIEEQMLLLQAKATQKTFAEVVRPTTESVKNESRFKNGYIFHTGSPAEEMHFHYFRMPAQQIQDILRRIQPLILH